MSAVDTPAKRNLGKRIAPAGIAGLFVIGAAIAIWFWHRAEKSSHPQADVAVPVHIVAVTVENVPIHVSGLGTVQASNTVAITSRVDGELDKVLFNEGKDVKRGDLLVVIDPRTFEAALDQAKAKKQQDEATLANARLILSRYAQLVGRGYSTQEQYDTQKSTVQQLEAAVAQDNAAVSNAATQLSYTQIKAPLDGRTGIRLVDPGNIVHANATNIVVITQLQPIDISATLAEDDLSSVRAALRAGSVEAVALSRDGSEQLGVGTLALVNNQIDPKSGTVQVKATFPNQEEKLWPGQFVVLQVRTKVVNEATVVPSGAIQRGPKGFFVYVIDSDRRANLRPVSVGQIAEGRSIINHGVAVGERVVTTGQYRLAPGLRVIATEHAGCKLDHTSIRPQPHLRQRGAGRADRHQRGERAVASEPSGAADLP